jgi:putative hemolysin
MSGVLHWEIEKINSLMTHRKSVVYLHCIRIKEVKEFMRHELHSVYPVYNSNYDDIVGGEF